MLIVIAALTLILMTIDHIKVLRDDAVYFYSQMILIVLLSTGAIFLIRLLLKVLEDRTRYIHALDQKSELISRIASSVEPQDAFRQVLHFVKAVLPDAEAALYLHDEDNRSLEYAAGYADGSAELSAENAAVGTLPDGELFLQSEAGCLACLKRNERMAHPFLLCNRGWKGSTPACTLSCLALMDSTRVAGMLQIRMPEGLTPTHEQVEVLEILNHEVAHTVKAAQEKKKRAEQALAQAVKAVQMDIARDLHDTLGQNIAYLNMALENLELKGRRLSLSAEAAAPEDVYGHGADIHQMRTVTGESYDLVRGTLAVLQTDVDSPGSLENLLSGHAEIVSRRSGMKVLVLSCGKPQALPSSALRHLYYFFREAIGNIEKYARASQVEVTMTWGKNSLSLTIADNGVGFDPADAQARGHYGLKFMRTRMDEIGGQFHLQTAPGEGTMLSVQLPLGG